MTNAESEGLAVDDSARRESAGPQGITYSGDDRRGVLAAAPPIR